MENACARQRLFSCSSFGTAGLLAALCLLTASSMLAQQNATVVGTITDTSGAVVPGAAITVANVNTGVARTAVTNSTGYYRVENLIPGQYTLSVESKGFNKAVRSAFTLEVAQTATLDMTLQLGSVTQTVEVTGATPMLQTQTAELGQVIQRQEVADLPLVDRNYLKLGLLAPGTSSYYNRSFESGALTNNIGTINSGGEGEDRNAFVLDGGDVKAYLINFSFIPSVDAIQEFKIETTPYAADLGGSPGAQIIITTRSGTNKVHGSGWEFLRNDKFDAKDYFATSKPELRKSQFGGVVVARSKRIACFSLLTTKATGSGLVRRSSELSPLPRCGREILVRLISRYLIQGPLQPARRVPPASAGSPSPGTLFRAFASTRRPSPC